MVAEEMVVWDGRIARLRRPFRPPQYDALGQTQTVRHGRDATRSLLRDRPRSTQRWAIGGKTSGPEGLRHW